MRMNLIKATRGIALAGAICMPLSALAQEHDKTRGDKSGEHAQDGKSPYGEVPADFYQREWLWVDRGENYKNVTKRLGKQAPNFTVDKFFENSKDKGMPLDKMKGKIVLIDFWATWCGPCIKNIPHTNEIAEKYYSQGVEVVGICNTRGAETMTNVAKDKDMFFPTGADQNNTTAPAYGVNWWPYYVIIDRDGKMQAAGIEAGKIEEVIESLLKYQPASKAKAVEREHGDGHEEGGEGHEGEGGGINEAWLEGDGAHRNKLDRISGQTPPALTLANWTNSSEMSLESLHGKVVMLDFWATWCGPCKAAIPHTNELQEKYKDDGLVIIGVCAKRGHETMAETAEQFKIAYPIAADTTGEVVKAYGVNGFPDYYFIDRAGNLRVADCKNGNIEDVIKVLLAEKE